MHITLLAGHDRHLHVSLFCGGVRSQNTHMCGFPSGPCLTLGASVAFVSAAPLTAMSPTMAQMGPSVATVAYMESSVATYVEPSVATVAGAAEVVGVTMSACPDEGRFINQ